MLTFVFSSGVHAAPFQNGSFEDGSSIDTYATIWPDGGYITNWILGGAVNYIGSYWQAKDGKRSLQLNANDPTYISQYFDTVPGALYYVSFAMSGNPDNQNAQGNPSLKEMTVEVTGSAPRLYSFDVSEMLNTHDDMKWVDHNFQFTAVSDSTTLTFTSTTPGAWGPVIDNVVINSNLPTSKEVCMDGNWQTLNIFRSQGDCISYVATGGRNLP